MTSSLILAILLLAIVLHGVLSMPKPTNKQARKKASHMVGNINPGSKIGPDSDGDGQDVTTVEGCTDRSKRCQRWAKDVDFSAKCKSKENGLNKKCRKTCGLCDDTTRSADESKPKRKQGGWNIKRGGWSRPKRSSLMTNKRSNKVPNTRKSPK